MQRPTPLLPTVTTPINLWPYKIWAKGNLRRGNWTETKEEPSINRGENGGKTERKKKAEPRLNREKNREEEKATKGRGDQEQGRRQRQSRTKKNWGRERKNQERQNKRNP
jgi:hypothetical protein